MSDSDMQLLSTEQQKWFKAAQAGNVPVLQEALSNGFDLNSVGIYVVNIYDGYSDCPKLLGTEQQRKTGLFQAVACDREPAVRFLLDNGADPKLKGVWGDTGIERTPLELAKYLLENGIRKNNQGIIQLLTDATTTTTTMMRKQ